MMRLAGSLALTLCVLGLAVLGGTASSSTRPLTPITADTAGRIVFESYELPPLVRAAAIGRAIATRSYASHPLAVWGDLFLPEQGASGPAPGVVIVHSSAGMDEHERGYARVLSQRGLAAFVIDSFGPRGIASTVDDQLQLSVAAMLLDAYRALDVLDRHPAVDGRRVAIIGFSRGGMVAEWAARRWYRDQMAEGSQRFAAHAAYYSWCGHQELKIALTGAPLLFLHGEADDWTPLALCRHYVERGRAAGYDVRLIAYPGAHHGFDIAGLPFTHLPHAEALGRCGYVYDAVGFTSLATGARYAHRQWLDFHRGCTTRGVHLAGDADAREAARAALMRFLTETL